MKIEITLEIELDENVWGLQPDEVEWMEKEIFTMKGGLSLHSDEIGDIVGTTTDVKNFILYPFK